MIKIYKKLVIILALPLLLTGCWDYKDINQRSIGMSVGIDKINDEIEFSGEIAKLRRQESTLSNAQVTEAYHYLVSGANFEEARARFDVKVPLEDFSGAQRVVVFGKQYAEEGIKAYINRAYNVQQFRSSALVTVSEEPARNFLSGTIKNDISIGYAVENTLRYLGSSGLALYKTIQQINSDMYVGDIGYLLPYIRKSNNTVEYLGLAAMKESKLVGIIKRENSIGYLFILSKKPQNTMVIPNPGDEKNLISIKSNLNKRKIKTSYENNCLDIYIYLNLDSQLAYPYKIETISEESIKKIEDQVSKKIKDDIVYAVQCSKNEFKCDVFGFEKYFKSQNPQEYKKIKWKDEYLNANFYVNVKAKITNTNLIDTNAKKQD